jgi:hypothetical protein
VAKQRGWGRGVGGVKRDGRLSRGMGAKQGDMWLSRGMGG